MTNTSATMVRRIIANSDLFKQNICEMIDRFTDKLVTSESDDDSVWQDLHKSLAVELEAYNDEILEILHHVNDEVK